MRAGRHRRAARRGHLRQRHPGGPRPEHGPPGRAQGRHPRRRARHHRQPRLRLQRRGSGLGRHQHQGRRGRDLPRGRHREHDARAVAAAERPHRLPHGHAARRDLRRHGAGRPVVRHRRLPHGPHRGEPQRALRHQQGAAERGRLPQPAQRQRGRQATGASRTRSCRWPYRSARATPRSWTPTSARARPPWRRSPPSSRCSRRTAAW